MQVKGLAIAMGLGAAVGAVAVTLLPRQSAARKLVDKTADVVEDAAQQVSNKLMEKMDM